MNKKYFVSRQNYSATEGIIRKVEIAVGGLDHAGPDMYPISFSAMGEGHEFNDPKEALRAARLILWAWLAVNHKIEISIVIMGGDLDDHPSSAQLDEWANTERKKLTKCDQCRKVIGGDPYVLFDVDDVRFCSEVCAEDYQQENAEWGWCSRCDNDVKATHLLDEGEVEIFLCDHCTGAFELGQAYPKAVLEAL